MALRDDSLPDKLEDVGDTDRLLRDGRGAWSVGYEDWGDTVGNEEGGKLTSTEVWLIERFWLLSRDGRVAGALRGGEG